MALNENPGHSFTGARPGFRGLVLPASSEHDFQNYVHRQLPLKADSLLSHSAAESVATDYLAHCTFRDRGLWVEVSREGQVVWIGVLAHWFDRTLIEQ